MGTARSRLVPVGWRHWGQPVLVRWRQEDVNRAKGSGRTLITRVGAMVPSALRRPGVRWADTMTAPRSAVRRSRLGSCLRKLLEAREARPRRGWGAARRVRLEASLARRPRCCRRMDTSLMMMATNSRTRMVVVVVGTDTRRRRQHSNSSRARNTRRWRLDSLASRTSSSNHPRNSRNYSTAAGVGAVRLRTCLPSLGRAAAAERMPRWVATVRAWTSMRRVGCRMGRRSRRSMMRARTRRIASMGTVGTRPASIRLHHRDDSLSGIRRHTHTHTHTHTHERFE